MRFGHRCFRVTYRDVTPMKYALQFGKGEFMIVDEIVNGSYAPNPKLKCLWAVYRRKAYWFWRLDFVQAVVRKGGKLEQRYLAGSTKAGSSVNKDWAYKRVVQAIANKIQKPYKSVMENMDSEQAMNALSKLGE